MTTANDPITELASVIQLGRHLATTARDELEAAVPVLTDALKHGSGQSKKIEALLWSCWNDDQQVNLCDCLASLDSKVAQAAVAMIAARAHLAGDADDLIRKIITESGSQPQTETAP